MGKAFRLGTPAGYLSHPPPEVQALRRKGATEDAAATVFSDASLSYFAKLCQGERDARRSNVNVVRQPLAL